MDLLRLGVQHVEIRRFLAQLLLVLSGAAVAVGVAPGGGAESSCWRGTVSRLYLGQSTPTGVVTEAQWRAFVAEAVALRFPHGFTELSAHGHWRDDRGTAIAEQTRIVEIAHDDSPQVRERIRGIATDYRRRFAQQSVLVTQTQSLQCFENGA
jgi:hypothetical protein